MKKIIACILFGGIVVLGFDNNENPLTFNIRATSSALSREWFQLSPNHLPSARSDHTMTYDSDRGVVILFGGVSGNGTAIFLNDTWEWNGYDWKRLYPNNSPPPRRAHAMVYDRFRKRIVMFGGTDDPSADGHQFNDTWEFDGRDWTEVAESGPGPRLGHGMAYDSNRRKVVLFSGYRRGWNWLNDTWEWDGTKWTNFSNTGPPAQNRPRMVYFEKFKITFLYSGHHKHSYPNEMWEWDGSEWTQINSSLLPPARSYHALAYDSDAQKVVLFGGLNYYANPTHLNDTWEWDGVNWTEIVLPIFPSRRESAGMVYDQERKEIFLFGGVNEGVRNNESWVYRLRNEPPVAVCKNIEISLDENCKAMIMPEDVDGGSYDPDEGDTITLSVENIGPFSLGEHIVNLTVTDQDGEFDTCQSTITAVDTTPPIITITDPICVNVRPGRGRMANKLTVSAEDNCSEIVDITIDKVEIFNIGRQLVEGKGIFEIDRNYIYVYPNANGWSIRVTTTAEDEYGNSNTQIIKKSLIKCTK